MWKIIRHPLFLYVVLTYLLFALVSNFASAQSFSQSGSWTETGSCYAGQHISQCQAACSTFAQWRVIPLPGCQQGANFCNKCQQSPQCPSGSVPLDLPASGPNAFTCVPESCPSGQDVNMTGAWPEITAQCIDDGGGENPPPICVPPNVEFNGDCVCDVGYSTQGYINGQPICQQQCPDGTFPGAVNGVSGCYGAGEQPDCPQGSYYGAVNGVWGCWGGDGSGGSNSSGGANSSSGGGSGSSSGNGGGGDGGAGGGGYEGAPYDPSEPCPSGYEKTANNTCEGQGDCFPGYTSVVISQSPFYAMCMPDEPPQSSSSSSQSSSSSSQQSSGAGTGSSSGGGSGSSSGSGGGGGGGNGGDGEGPEFSGECDPTAANYLDCIAPAGDMPTHTQTDSGATTFAEVNANFFNALSQTGPIVAMSNMANIIELDDPACPAFSIDLSDTIIGRVLSTDIHCLLYEEIAGILSVVMAAVWLFAAFRIFASA